MEVSPNERYILSFNGTITDAPNTENYIVWNLRTGEKIRAFKADRLEVWGAYQWSSDSAFLARMNESSSEELQISVYRMPLCDMIANEEGKKNSIKVAGLQRFGWVEGSKTLCCVSFGSGAAKGQGQNLTKVTMIEVRARCYYRRLLMLFVDSEQEGRAQVEDDHLGGRGLRHRQQRERRLAGARHDQEEQEQAVDAHPPRQPQEKDPGDLRP